MVRFTQAVLRIRGCRKVVWFVSSLLDPTLYPAMEVVQFYGRRWRIEMLFQSVKINLGADVLRSLNAVAIRKEIAARMMAVNLVRMIMLESVTGRGIDPVRISFAYAVRVILMFAPSLAIEPVWRLPDIYDAMLCEIASHRVPERPGRNEPRAVRRERVHYPSLKMTRRQWRINYAA
ncbi:MAG: transposase [Anaerohalosphaeraceae bacterium]